MPQNSESTSNPTQSANDERRAIAGEFNDALHAGESPKIEEFLDRRQHGEADELLRELLALEIAFRSERGEALKREEYDARFPNQTAVIDVCFATPVSTDWSQKTTLTPTTIDLPTPPLVEEVGAPASARHSPQKRFGDYELLEQIARGGMGVVYKARQTRLDRIVALKMILAGHLASDDAVSRFYTEAESAGKLDHPNIVPVYDVGECDGQHYFSMGYVEGKSLQQVLAEGPLASRDAATMMASIADAVQYAHQQGIIHRDLKPSNILLAGHGAVDREKPSDNRSASIPRVTDFGLAKRLDAEDSPTLSGQVMGTPPFMPPEQARGDLSQVGPRSDVYSLGATLYAMITGRPPFQGASIPQTLDLVRNREPVAPRQLNPAVDRDLETICLKGLQKEPEKRYGSAGELANDLRRFLNGEPIAARPVGRWERGWRWCRRHPARAGFLGTAAVAVLAMVGLAVGYFYQQQLETKNRELNSANATLDERNRQLDRARGDVETKNQQLTQANGELRTTAAKLDVALINETALRNDATNRSRNAVLTQQLARVDRLMVENPQRGLEQLEDRTACPLDLRDFAWRYYHKLCSRKIATFSDRRQMPLAVAVTPDGKRLITGGLQGTLLVRDLVSGQVLSRLQDAGDAIWDLAISPDGKLLAVADGPFAPPGSKPKKQKPRPGHVTIWDLESLERKASLSGPAQPVTSVAISPDGKTLAAGSSDKVIRLWSLPDGKLVGSLTGHQRSVKSIEFYGGGKFLASAGAKVTATTETSSGEIFLWDVGARKSIDEIPNQTSAVTSLAVSPDGRLLAAAGIDRKVRLWNLPARTLQRTWDGPTGAVAALAFSPDGTRLAGGGSSNDGLRALRTGTGYIGHVRIWNAGTGAVVCNLFGHTMLITDVAFTPRGRRIVSTSLDRTTAVWKANADMLPWMIPHRGAVRGLAVSPDGRWLASSSSIGDRVETRGVIQLLDLETGKTRFTLTDHKKRVESLVFSRDSGTLVSSGADEVLKFWNVADGKLLKTVEVAKNSATSIDWSPSDDLLATGGNDGVVRLRSSRDGRLVASLRGNSQPIWDVKFSPDGERLAIGCQNGSACVYNVRSRELRSTLRGHAGEPFASVTSVAFSPDGRTLATASYDRTVRLWDLTTGTTRAILDGHNKPVLSVAFSPGGRTCVTGSMDGTVRLWDTANGLERARIPVPSSGSMTRVAFHPDGETLFAGTATAGLKIWDLHLPTTSTPTVLHGHRLAPVWCVALSPDGRFIASGAMDRTVRIWSTQTGREVATWTLPGITYPFCVQFSADGKRVAAGDVSMRVTVWDRESGRQLHHLKIKEAAANGKTPQGQPTVGTSFKMVMSVAFSPDGSTLYAANVDKDIKRWALPTGKPLPPMRGHTGAVVELAINRQGSHLASVGMGNVVRLWDLSSGKSHRLSFTGDDAVLSIAFTPDGRQLMIGGGTLIRGRIEVWDVQTKKRLRTLAGHSTFVGGLAVSGDGKRLLSGSTNLGVLLWDMSTGKPIVRLKPTVGASVQKRPPLAISRDGRLAVTAGPDSTVQLWSITASRNRKRFVFDPFRHARQPVEQKRSATGQDDGMKMKKVKAAVDRLFGPDGKIGVMFQQAGQANQRIDIGLAFQLRQLGLKRMKAKAYADARDAFEQALDRWRKLSNANPANLAFRFGVAEGLNFTGAAHLALGKSYEATYLYRRSLSAARALVRERPDYPAYQLLLALVERNLAGRIFGSDRKRADELLQASIDRLNQLRKKHAGNSTILQRLVAVYVRRAELLDTAEDYAGAAGDWRRAFSLERTSRRSRYALKCAISLARAGSHAESTKLGRRFTKASDPRTFFQLARLFALNVTAVARDRRLGEKKRRLVRDDYAKQAIDLLQRARDRGLFEQSAYRRALTSDTILQSLHVRNDYRTFAQTLGIRTPIRARRPRGLRAH